LGGGKVDRQKREPSRGAQGAEGVKREKGVSSFPQEKGSGEQVLPLPQKIFDILGLK